MIHSPDYKKAKIYKLTCSETNRIYIGSTTKNPHYRLLNHLSQFNPTMAKTFKKPELEVLFEYPCECKRDLLLKEREIIKEHRENGFEVVNKNVPGRTLKEWIQDNRERVLQQKRKAYHKNPEFYRKLSNKHYHESGKKERIKINRAKKNLQEQLSKPEPDFIKVETYIKRIKEGVESLKAKNLPTNFSHNLQEVAM